jgi:hypothetical protein
MDASERSAGLNVKVGLPRLKAFAENVFEPKLHLLFAGFWSLSLLGNLHVVSGVRAWRWDASAIVLVLSVFGCLFFLRIVDEIKDYEYDVVHNPDRPLVAGLVGRADLFGYLGLLALLLLFVNAVIAVPLALWIALDLSYGLLQLLLEKWSERVRSNLVVNLIAVYPVNVALSVYTLLFFFARTVTPFQSRQAWLIVAYACAFLHFEFARKSAWPHLARSGERLYSQLIGLGGSLALSTGFGLAALGLVLWLFAPWAQSGVAAVTGWLPLLGLAPMTLGVFGIVRSRHRRFAPRPLAVAFLFTFYPTMLIHAVATRLFVWGA